MNRSILAIAALGLSAAPACAGFNLTTTFTNLTGIALGPYSRITVDVHNAGMGGTFGNSINTFDGLDGVALRAVVHTPTGPARRMRWMTGDFTGPDDTPDGEIDTFDIFNLTETFVPSLTDFGGFLRSIATSSLNTYTGIHPYPITVANNPWQQGTNYFDAAVVQTGNNTAANSSPGYRAIKLIVDDGSVVRLTGRLGGNAGPDIPFQLDVNGTYTNGAPYLELAAYYVEGTIDDGFSMTADAIDPDAQIVTVELTGTLPDFVSLVSTPAAPAEFTIENNRPLTMADVGLHPIVIRATDPNGAYTDTEIAIRIPEPIPEPASMMMLGGIGFVTLRRRRS